MKLSDLKVGDKFRFANSDEAICEVVAPSRRRSELHNEEVAYWSDVVGYYSKYGGVEVELITDPPGPKYRPYSDLRCMFGAKVRHKVNRCEYIVTKTQTSYCKFENAVESPDDMLQNYEYLDGTPCGELVNED